MSKTTKYRVMLDHHEHKTKKNASQYAGKTAQSLLRGVAHVTIQELANHAMEGKTFIPSELKYLKDEAKKLKENPSIRIGASSRHWVSQQLFAVDIDNEHYNRSTKSKQRNIGDQYLLPDSILSLCQKSGIAPALIYETLSSTDKHKRYRVIFALNKRITLLTERDRIFESLLTVFTVNGQCLVDTSCTGPAKMFFGGKAIVHLDHTAVNTVKHLLSIPALNYMRDSKKPKLSKAEIKKAVLSTGNETAKLLATGDWLSLKNKFKAKIAEYDLSALEPYVARLEPSSPDGDTSPYIYFILRECVTNWLNAETPWAIRDQREFYLFCSYLPLELFFDKELNESFNCILPEHLDLRPSARFERTDKGQSIYHCYGCNYRTKEAMLDIFDLVEALTGMTHLQVKEKIAYLFNFSIETEWQRQKRAELNELRNMFMYPELIQDHAPELYKHLRRSNMLGFLTVVLSDAAYYLRDISFSGLDEIYYIADLGMIANRLKALGMRGHQKLSISRKFHKAAALGLIAYESDKSNYFVRKSQEARLKNIKSGRHYAYHTSVIKIFPLTIDMLYEAERRLLELKKKGFLSSATKSRQAYVWIEESKEAVDQHYVQDKDNNVKSKTTLQAYERFKKASEDLLQAQGYFTQKELLSHKRVRAMKQKKELLAVVTPELLKVLNITHTVYSHYYAELFGISQAKKRQFKPGRTKIYIYTKDLKSKQ